MSGTRRVLLDECVPGRLKRELPDFSVRTVRECGWASKLDGHLLRDAEAEFDVLVAYSNNIRVLRLLLPELLDTLGTIQPGQVVHVGPPAA